MSEHNAVQWFEIPVTNLTRAKKFYESVTGLELSLQEMGPNKMAWFPMAQGVPGATGALIKGQGYEPSKQGSLVYISVADLDKAVEQVKRSGGSVTLPKTSIGEYGSIARFVDSEGNLVALHSKN